MAAFVLQQQRCIVGIETCYGLIVVSTVHVLEIVPSATVLGGVGPTKR